MERQELKKTFSIFTFKNKQLQFMGWIGRWVNSGDNMKKHPMNAENLTHLLQALGFVVSTTEEHKPINTEKNPETVLIKITYSNTGSVFCLKREINVDLIPDDPINMTLDNLDVEDQGEPINLEGSPKKMSFELSKIITAVINYLMHMMYDTQYDDSQIVPTKQIPEIEPTTEMDLKPEEKTAKSEPPKSEKSRPGEKRRNVPYNVLDLLKNASSTIANAITVIETAPEIQETPTKPETALPVKTSWLSPGFRFFRSSSTSAPATTEAQEPKKVESKKQVKSPLKQMEPEKQVTSPLKHTSSFYQLRTNLVPNVITIDETKRLEKLEVARKELERKEAERKEAKRLEAEKKEIESRGAESKDPEKEPKETEKKEA